MNSKNKGDLSESAILFKLLEIGASVSVPWGDNQPYDLIIDYDNCLYRVQCKTARISVNCIVFGTKSVYKVKGKTVVVDPYTGYVDLWACYEPCSKQVYLFTPNEITQSQSCYKLISSIDSNKVENFIWMGVREAD